MTDATTARIAKIELLIKAGERLIERRDNFLEQLDLSSLTSGDRAKIDADEELHALNLFELYSEEQFLHSYPA